MALLTPTLLDTKSYDFSVVRNIWTRQIYQSGVLGKGDFAITPKASQPPLAITVAAGEAWVKATAGTRNGAYHVVNDAAVDINLTAADATNPRIDRVVLRINDSSDLSSATDVPDLYVITGTPTAGATLANLTGAGAAPANSVTLGFVRVTAGMTSTTTANIGWYGRGTNTFSGAIAGAPPPYAIGRPFDFIPSCGLSNSANQSIPNNTATTLTFDTESDNDGLHSTSSNTGRITIQTPGVYQFSGLVSFAANATGVRGLTCRIGETLNIWQDLRSTASAGSTVIPISFNYPCSYGDIFDLQAYQTSGGALNSSYQAFLSPSFSAQWIAPA